MTWLETIRSRVAARDKRILDDPEMLDELILTAFEEIMNYSHADRFDKSWNSVLVECVIRLYNYSGVEGSIIRDNGGVKDHYESSYIITTVLAQSRIKSLIRPSGYVYPEDRFKFPE